MEERINLTGQAWLLAHREDMPLHVAGLAVFERPDGAGEDFVPKLLAQFHATRTFASPFNRRLLQTFTPKLIPEWEVLADEEIDIEHHVRHCSLPDPGGETELGALVSRLHSVPHDLTRPLWQLHVIDGLSDGRFAMYMKVHHALIDGVGLIRRMTHMVTDDPTDHDRPPVWAIDTQTDPQPAPPEPHTAPPPSLATRIAGAARLPAELVADGVRLSTEFIVGAARFAQQALWPTSPDTATMYSAPRSLLNNPITPRRRVCTQSFELDRIKRVATAADTTVNNILLAISAAALRRYLLTRDALPAASLTAAAPASTRDAADTTAGNAFSLLLIKLHTDLASPLERIAAIAKSSRAAKALLAGLPKPVADNFGVLVFGRSLIEVLLKLPGLTPPPCNLIISNVPGPGGALYFNGAALQHLYPVSVIFDGLALSITALSTGDRFNLGIVGCPDTLPHLQQLATYHSDALAELEQALNIRD
jgi:WS/DGAT/MGAT family acyltransferase